ncbi:MAG: SWIM zinc finger family protein [Prosthecobacter sp.]
MWWDYQDVEEQKKQIQREIAKRTKRGEKFEVLAAPAGQKKLCTTFWGQAWCKNLESYQVYESRLPRGRSYLRQGKVYNLDIGKGELGAVVAGSELYDTKIHIKPLPEKQWKEIVKAGAGEVGSMLDLLSGRLGDGLMRLLTDPERGLFPEPKEIRFDCSCPDYADMCKHVSAVLYGVGVLLDSKPELLFTLRGVDQAELLSDASNAAITDVSGGRGDELGGADLSALFGIDLGVDVAAMDVSIMVDEPVAEPGVGVTKASKTKPKAPARKSAVKKPKAAAKKTATKKKREQG